MKRFPFFLLITAGAWLSSCKRDNLTLFNSPANVYFNFTDAQRDSLLYSFALDPARTADTVFLPVELSGIRVDSDRQFIVRIDPDSTTATAYKHYKPLDSIYTLPANTGTYSVPLIIYNTDTALQSRSVQIKFKLFPTHDLDTSLSQLISGRLVFSNKLERPDWWGDWMGDYFSQAKYFLFMLVTGQTSLTSGTQGGLDAPKNLYFVGLLTNFLADPFTWVSKNPDEGYIMEKQNDGSYLFYNPANVAAHPSSTDSKKIPYRFDAQASKYFFIDENGLEIN